MEISFLILKCGLLRVFFSILECIQKAGIIPFHFIKFRGKKLNSVNLLFIKTEPIRSIIPKPVVPNMFQMGAGYGLSQGKGLQKN